MPRLMSVTYLHGTIEQLRQEFCSFILKVWIDQPCREISIKTKTWHVALATDVVITKPRVASSLCDAGPGKSVGARMLVMIRRQVGIACYRLYRHDAISHIGPLIYRAYIPCNMHVIECRYMMGTIRISFLARKFRGLIACNVFAELIDRTNTLY